MSDEKTVYTWSGKELAVAWNEKLCIHIGECTRAKGELFKSGRQDWAEPDRAAADEVIEVIHRCPTGALTYERLDGSAGETVEPDNTVMVVSNGPLYVRGDIRTADAADEAPGVRYRAAFCRCGQSANKPFCDNSHEEASFRDRGAVGETGDGCPAPGGALAVTRAKNGPLLLSGNMTILAGSGRPTWRGTKAALCRCGDSKNKPFCDGAHVAAGFVAD